MNSVHINYLQEWVSCGKPNCRCGRSEKHGPYWYAYWCTRGRRHRRYIGKVYRELGAAELGPQGSGEARPRIVRDRPSPQSTRRPIRKRAEASVARRATPPCSRRATSFGEASGTSTTSAKPASPTTPSPPALNSGSSPSDSVFLAKKKEVTREELRAMAVDAGYPPDRVEGAVEWASVLAETGERTIGGVRVIGRGEQYKRGRVVRAADRSCWYRFTPNRYTGGPDLWVTSFPTRKAAKEE